MNKEQLFEEIDEIYSEWHGGELHIGIERIERIKEVLNRAINFIPCCTELKNKEVLTFDEYVGKFVLEIKNNKYLHKHGGWWSYAEINWKVNSYNKHSI